MKKRTLKPKILKTFTESEVGALIEDFRADFRVFGEGLDDVRSSVDDLRSKYTRLDFKTDTMLREMGAQRKDIDVLKTDVKELKIDVRDIKGMLKVHDKRLIRLEVAR